MRALLKKELTEVLVPFGIAFLVITVVWLGSVRFWDALLPPAESLLAVVGLSSGLTGAVLGYLQFSSERWRGKLGYLVHRGTGVEGAFLSKVIAGLLGTLLVGFGPPAVYALSAKLFSPNAPIVQGALVLAYARISMVGASFYGLGVLAASLRRRAFVGAALVAVGSLSLFYVQFLSPLLSAGIDLAGGSILAAWALPASHLAFGALLLYVALRLTRSSVDRNLPLPSWLYRVAILLALPLVLLPLELGIANLRGSLMHRVRSEQPILVRDQASGEIFPIVSGDVGGHFRLHPDGSLGDAVEYRGPADPNTDLQIVLWPYAGSRQAASADGPPPDDPAAARAEAFGIGEGLELIWLQRADFGDARRARGAGIPNCRVYLDRQRGTVCAFAFVYGLGSTSGEGGTRRAPFAIEIEKPGGSGRFSPSTVKLRGWSEAVARVVPSVLRADDWWSEGLNDVLVAKARRNLVYPCLVDPEDGTCWRLDIDDLEAPLARVELPGGDRFLRLESVYSKSELVFGRYENSWEDPVVVGERGRYVWNSRAFEEYVPVEKLTTARDGAGLVQFRILLDEEDPLRSTVRVLDAKDDRELFAYTYAPRTKKGALLASLAQATVLLRSPLANTLVFTGMIQPKVYPGGVTQIPFDPFLLDGRRPGLWLLDVAIALGCAALCGRMLRGRGASAVSVGLVVGFVLFFGPTALLVVWLLEPKGAIQQAPGIVTVPQPALAIQSA